MQKSPQYADAVPSTSEDPTTTTSIMRSLQFDTKVDELLGTPKPKKGNKDKKRSGACVLGLPRCVLDVRFREMLKGKEDEKKIEKEKAECKKQQEESKKKKGQACAEAKAKKEAECIAKAQVKAMGKMGTRQRKPTKKVEEVEVKSSEPSSSYDDSSSSVYETSDKEWKEGS